MLIEDQEAFDRVLSDLRKETHFCLDTEFISERSFRPRLCLLQIGYGETNVAVDPFGVRELGGFLELILDPSIEKVLHAGQQDMMIFYDLTGRVPENVFDTQIAAALLGHGDSIGYSRLVEACLKVKLTRDEAYTDWSRRPLTPRQVEYALDDVRYLKQVRKLLHEQLTERGRESWLEDELKIYRDVNYYRRDPETLYRRFRAAGNMSGVELSVLQELALWREKEAESRDKPRGSILSDDAICDLARRRPKDFAGLQRLRSLHPRLIKRSGKEFLQRIREAEGRPRDSFPVVAKPPRKSPESMLLVDVLEVMLKARAAELEISPKQLATRTQLHTLVRAFEDGEEDLDLPVLKGWRGELMGKALLDFLQGQSTIGVDPGTRRVVVRTRN